MLKEFYEKAIVLIRTMRILGQRKPGERIVWFSKGHDHLGIFRDAPNCYLISFLSHTKGNSWRHCDVSLREVVCAIKSFDGGTDMLGNPFHNIKEGTFEY